MARTIWSPGVLRHVDPQQRFLVLYIFPLIYTINALTYLIFGTVNGGSRVMRAAFGEWGTFALNSGIGLAALGGLLGLAFVRHQLERWCAIAMVSGTFAYLILLFFALGAGSAPVSTLSGTLISSVIIGARVRQIARDIGRSRAAA